MTPSTDMVQCPTCNDIQLRYDDFEYMYYCDKCDVFLYPQEVKMTLSTDMSKFCGPGAHPIQDVVWVKPATVDDKTPGGIIIPEKSKLKTCEGTVVSVGPGLVNKKSGRRSIMSVQPGDNILYEHGRGIRVDFKGQKYIVMREPDIALILDKPQKNQYDPSSFYEQKEISV